MNAAVQALCNLPSIQAVLTSTTSSTYYTTAHQKLSFTLNDINGSFLCAISKLYCEKQVIWQKGQVFSGEPDPISTNLQAESWPMNPISAARRDGICRVHWMDWDEQMKTLSRCQTSFTA